jgi:hypothetical protein
LWYSDGSISKQTLLFPRSLCIGLYQDQKNGVLDGACPPLLIHTDKGKTKAKEKDERNRQRNGEMPWNDDVSPRFLKGLDKKLGVKIATTHSGSMTQEVFYKFAEHFIAALPNNHEPVLLLLDGHGSRWNAQALQLLMQNKVYPFIIASHTSIGLSQTIVG